MRFGSVQRVWAAVVLVAAVIFSCAPALAASQLSGIVVVPARGRTVRVALSFIGGIPSGWTITGAGTATPTVVLPSTAPAPSVNQLAYGGTGSVSSVSLAQSGGTLTITLHLTAALRIAPRAINNVLFIDVASLPPAVAAPAAMYGAAPAIGDIGNGQHYEVIPLKYADVSEVVGLLVQGQQITPNDVFTPVGSIFSLPTSSNGIPTQTSYGSPFGSPQTTPPSMGERVNDNVGYDRRLNAIVLYGTPQQIAQYKAFIASIDVPIPSVMLECAVLELDQTAARNLGIDFTNPNGQVASGSATLGPLNTGTGLLTSPNITASLQAALYATIAHGGGKILATPRVLALNGQPAQILSGDALPIAQTTYIPGQSTTYFQSTINYIAVGINMQIQPRIDADGFVTSHIYAEASSVTQYVNAGGQQVPQVSLRQVSTSATVQDGQPFIVGGLLLDEEITNLSKIPILGDLPLIGGLFRVRHDTTQRTNLYIIITPHVIQHTGVPVEPLPKLPSTEVPGSYPTFAPPPP
ncbi:MAG TPA: secretin N-terminal domain-containing protein [Candidatus Baltobacteraceae bacterium]|nr:secretin N-terminal domain-containing protein [Candidatus Baltobacteraceae bacterium]